jgi:hypothetical protein
MTRFVNDEFHNDYLTTIGELFFYLPINHNQV